jgi:capsular polysaccharide biosynthesis protein
MELKQLWMVLVRRWWLIVIPALVALALSLGSLKTLVRPPESYTTAIRFTASQRPSGTPNSAENFDKNYTVWLTSEYIATNLASWMNTESFASAVKAKLDAQNVSIDLGALRGAIHSDSARSVMTLYLQGWPDPEQLKTIAQSAIDVLQHEHQTYWPEVGTQPIEIVALDDITVVPESTPLATRFAGFAKVGIGFIAGLALAFLAEYLDPSVRQRAELESLGFKAVIEIPR